MKVNFKIEDWYALNFEERHIDLHNCFDFKGFQFDNLSRNLKLCWIKSNGNWIKNDELKSLILEHKKVSFLKITERDPETPFSEDSRLSDLTFAPGNEKEIYSLYDINIPETGNIIKYIFQSQQVICVGCEEIELIVEE